MSFFISFRTPSCISPSHFSFCYTPFQHIHGISPSHRRLPALQTARWLLVLQKAVKLPGISVQCPQATSGARPSCTLKHRACESQRAFSLSFPSTTLKCVTRSILAPFWGVLRKSDIYQAPGTLRFQLVYFPFFSWQHLIFWLTSFRIPGKLPPALS